MNDNELFHQAEQVFVDCNQFTKSMVIGFYRLLCDILEEDALPAQSATITGLDCVMMSIYEYDILYNYYFQRMTFEDIASNVLKCTSARQVRRIHKRLLKKLRTQAIKFFFPEREAFIARYIKFIHAVQTNCPTTNDLSIKEVGLNTRTANALYREGLTTASQLYFASQKQLLKIKGIGRPALEEIWNLKYSLLCYNM